MSCIRKLTERLDNTSTINNDWILRNECVTLIKRFTGKSFEKLEKLKAPCLEKLHSEGMTGREDTTEVQRGSIDFARLTDLCGFAWSSHRLNMTEHLYGTV